MSTLAERINSLLNQKDISQTELAKLVGISQPSMNKILNGSTLNPKKIIELAGVLDVDPAWLKTGEKVKDSTDPVYALHEPSAEYRSHIKQLNISAAAGHNGFSNADYPDVIRSIYFSEQGLLEIVGIKNTDGIYLITVPTDSMSPTINKGDLVFVDTKINSYVNEGIYVFDLNGETYIKRLQRIPTGVIRALSDNPLYPPFDITEELFSTAVIRGKFIRVLPINPKNL